MTTNNMTREQISALADGELPKRQVDMALTALRQDSNRADWELYHQIGDVLRSEDMAVALSPGFAARMATRLDTESAMLAPVPIAHDDLNPLAKYSLKRWAMPSAVATVAMVAVTFVAVPQLMVAMNGEPAAVVESGLVAAAARGEQSSLVIATGPDGAVLRDPRMDDYLLAHQRFSPSLYSTAQYARTATLATDSNK
jgi:sigma-E factor negative regulatory protein RseA